MTDPRETWAAEWLALDLARNDAWYRELRRVEATDRLVLFAAVAGSLAVVAALFAFLPF